MEPPEIRMIAVTDNITHYAVVAITVTMEELRSYDVELTMTEEEAVSTAKHIVEQYKKTDIGS